MHAVMRRELTGGLVRAPGQVAGKVEATGRDARGDRRLHDVRVQVRVGDVVEQRQGRPFELPDRFVVACIHGDPLLRIERDRFQRGVGQALGDQVRLRARRRAVAEVRVRARHESHRARPRVRRGQLERLSDARRHHLGERATGPHAAAHERLERKLGAELARVALSWEPSIAVSMPVRNVSWS